MIMPDGTATMALWSLLTTDVKTLTVAKQSSDTCSLTKVKEPRVGWWTFVQAL